MNKKALVIVAALLLIFAVGWGVMSSKKVSEAPKVKIDDGGMNVTPSTGSLKDILTGGKSQTCTFETQGSKGSVYVSGGKVRGDFDVTISGQTTKSHMIVMDSTSYIWTDGQPTGFKMSFDPNAKPVANNTTQSGFDPTADNNYKCSSWTSDPTVFVLPTTVNFNSIDLPSRPGDPPVPADAGSASQCSYCNSLSGDDKTQCLTALKCN